MSSSQEYVRTCFYEVLGVERDATEAEIKKGYYKSALKWHPDKQSHKDAEQQELANQMFKEIQNAYSVLADPHEREWYDNHRESILRGGDGKGEDDEEGAKRLFNPWPYFRSSCYTTFNDEDENNFYVVFSEVFRQIEATEEACESVSEYHKPMPVFGSSTTPWSAVSRFYEVWMAFSSKQKFLWLNKWKLSEAPSRRVKRLMEKDNAKLREEAKREYNESIRALVKYVSKRDERVKEHAAKEEARKEAAKERARKDKEERIARHKEELEQMEDEMVAQEEERWEAYQKEMRDLGMDGELFEEEVDLDTGQYSSTYCVACRRPFKSEKALENHCRSKKHLENMKRLRAEVSLGEDEDGEKGETKTGGDSSPAGDEGDDQQNPGAVVSGRRTVAGEQEEEEEEAEEDQYLQAIAAKKAKKAKKKAKKRNKHGQAFGAMYEEPVGRIDALLEEEQQVEAQEELQAVPRNGGSEGESGASSDVGSETSETASEIGNDDDEDDGASDVGKKKRRRRAKKNGSAAGGAAAAATATADLAELELICGVCRQEFPTRNKLFTHIRKTGHAMLKDGSKKGRGGKRKK